MSYTIYLYGSGASSTGRKQHCYFKCEIPETSYSPESGLFPSVLHSYIMYAKDIGLTVTDLIYEGFDSKKEKLLLATQLPYSLWPLFYVNNSEAFTEGNTQGVALWSKQDTSLAYETSIRLQTTLAYYYRDKSESEPAKPDLSVAQLAGANPLPKPNSEVQTEASWYLDLTTPDKGDAGSNASSYSIVKHYNQYVIADTISDMVANIGTTDRYAGLKGATGKTLQNVVDRRYAYDALMPAWSSAWGDETPEWYDKMRLSMNNYNISASIFLYDQGKEPDSPVTAMTPFATASNIKGQIKSGHAETRLLLSLDTINYAATNIDWYRNACGFYGFDSIIDEIADVLEARGESNMAFISSLKPCYLCVGEVDSTTEGFIDTIDGKTVEMFASFHGPTINTAIKNVIYFDIDRPIVYPSTINVTVHIDGALDYNWDLSLCPWTEWTASAGLQEAIISGYSSPIGPRIVEPAGECLKTGYSYIRYRNSSQLLLTDGSDYYKQFKTLTSTIAYESGREQ